MDATSKPDILVKSPDASSRKQELLTSLFDQGAFRMTATHKKATPSSATGLRPLAQLGVTSLPGKEEKWNHKTPSVAPSSNEGLVSALIKASEDSIPAEATDAYHRDLIESMFAAGRFRSGSNMSDDLERADTGSYDINDVEEPSVDLVENLFKNGYFRKTSGSSKRVVQIGATSRVLGAGPSVPDKAPIYKRSLIRQAFDSGACRQTPKLSRAQRSHVTVGHTVKRLGEIPEMLKNYDHDISSKNEVLQVGSLLRSDVKKQLLVSKDTETWSHKTPSVAPSSNEGLVSALIKASEDSIPAEATDAYHRDLIESMFAAGRFRSGSNMSDDLERADTGSYDINDVEEPSVDLVENLFKNGYFRKTSGSSKRVVQIGATSRVLGAGPSVPDKAPIYKRSLIRQAFDSGACRQTPKLSRAQRSHVTVGHTVKRLGEIPEMLKNYDHDISSKNEVLQVGSLLRSDVKKQLLVSKDTETWSHKTPSVAPSSNEGLVSALIKASEDSIPAEATDAYHRDLIESMFTAGRFRSGSNMSDDLERADAGSYDINDVEEPSVDLVENLFKNGYFRKTSGSSKRVVQIGATSRVLGAGPSVPDKAPIYKRSLIRQAFDSGACRQTPKLSRAQRSYVTVGHTVKRLGEIPGSKFGNF